MIYLCSPYSHPDPAIMERRFDAACRIAGRLMAAGELVLSPIAHTHPIAVRCELPRGWEFWDRYDRDLLAKADKVIVAMMAGWQESVGVQAEIAIAKQLGLPIEYLAVDDLIEG